MPTSREVEVNDVFDTYRVIARKITPWCKRKKRLVFIDDLDRVNDKRIIIAFLKELYRFQDSITKNKNQIVFIVSVKPESELKDNSEQPNPPTSNKKDFEDDGKKADQLSSEHQNYKETSLIYPKVFDTTLFLKPITSYMFLLVFNQLVPKQEGVRNWRKNQYDNIILPSKLWMMFCFLVL